MKNKGFSIIEVMMSLSILGLTTIGVVKGYVYIQQTSERSAYSLAAQSMTVSKMEQIRAAKWCPQQWPAIDQVIQTNFPTVTNILDIPIRGTNCTRATVYTTIQTLTNKNMKCIRVDCVWPFINGKMFTNSMTTYRAPN